MERKFMRNVITPETILTLSRNFMESRILLTAAELNLFALLAPHPLSAGEVAKHLHGPLRAATILLDALSAMGLLVKHEKTYQCIAPVSNFLSPDQPESVLPMILHATHLWQRWSKLTAVLSESEGGAEEADSPSQKYEELRAFIGAMHAIAAPLAPLMVKAVRAEKSRMLLDVGGASGTYTLAFLGANPQMRVTLFDRPAVIEMARERLEKANLLHRVNLVAGDFYEEDLPTGHDLAFVSAIIHQNSPEENLDLFKKIFRSLLPGGRIVIRDHVMEPERTQPPSGAIFAVNMPLATAGGNTYTFEEIQAGLVQSGFVLVRLIQKGKQMDGLIEAFKP
jgi:predicted O-methyltransferase YrrM